MSLNKAKITFHLRLDKMSPVTQEAPIYLRITVNRKRVNLSINRAVNPERWKQTEQLQKARKTEARELSLYMDSIRSRIKEIERELLESKITITAENIKNRFTGISNKSKSLLEAFEYHNTNFKALVLSGQAAKGTLDRYTAVIKHLKAFLKFQYNKNDIMLEELEYSFVTHFDFYFRTNRKCNNNTTVKYIRNFRKIIKMSVEEGWMKYDVFTKYT